jgi:hypothetical protein
MKKGILLAAAATVTVLSHGVVAGVFHPGISVKHQPRFHITFPLKGATVLYDQSEADNGVGIVSQNFEDSFDVYDSAGRDDFTVPAGQKWKISQVGVSGAYFNGSGPATSFGVTVWVISRDGTHRIYGETGKPFKDDLAWTIIYLNNGGTDPGPIIVKGGKKGQKYQISVQAEMDYNTGGEWAWNTNNTVRGNPSEWENPGDGFATGCTDWTVTTTCVPSGEGGDFAFALYGKAR